MNVAQVFTTLSYLLCVASASQPISTQAQEQHLAGLLEDMLDALDTLDATIKYEATSQELTRRLTEWDTLKVKLAEVVGEVTKKEYTSMSEYDPLSKQYADLVTISKYMFSSYNTFFAQHQSLTDVAPRLKEMLDLWEPLDDIKLPAKLSFEAALFYGSVASEIRFRSVFDSDSPLTSFDFSVISNGIQSLMDMSATANEYIKMSHLDSYSKALAKRTIQFYYKLANKLSDRTKVPYQTVDKSQLDMIDTIRRDAEVLWEQVEAWPEFEAFSRHGRKPPVSTTSNSMAESPSTGNRLMWTLTAILVLSVLVGVALFVYRTKTHTQPCTDV